jgi:anti-sigma regulatory factor (Ser/Thr protein kinase)
MSMPPTPQPRDDVRSDDQSDRAMTLLPRDRRTPVDARDWLHGFLAGRVAPTLAEDAALVISELATNALRHGLGEVVVRAAIEEGGAVQLSVTDSGDELPLMQPADPARIGGLGLRIVDQLSTAWGVAPFPGGKTVWATVAPTR